MNWSEIQKEITRAYGEKIIKWHEHNARRIYIDIEKHDLAECSRVLFEKLHGRFIVASGVDTPFGVIEILYHFDFFQLPQVVSLRVRVDKNDLSVVSLAPAVKGAEWIEREIAELFGVEFTGHPDMRHLILPDDWPKGNYPLRRDQ